MIYYLTSTFLTIGAFLLGVNIGLRIKKEEPIKLPNIPKAIKEKKIEKEQDKELKRFNTILQNIDNYDGTGKGQKVIK